MLYEGVQKLLEKWKNCCSNNSQLAQFYDELAGLVHQDQCPQTVKKKFDSFTKSVKNSGGRHHPQPPSKKKMETAYPCVSRILVRHKKLMVRLRKKRQHRKLLLDKIISNHLVVTKIFSNLPLHTLLKCRLVNTTWHSIMVQVLRDRKCLIEVCYAHLTSGLETFSKILKNRSPRLHLPFNGLMINDNGRCCLPRMETQKDPNFDLLTISFLYQIQIKYLHIHSWAPVHTLVSNEAYSILKALQKIFIICALNLQEISMTSIFPFLDQLGYLGAFFEKSDDDDLPTTTSSSSGGSPLMLPNVKKLSLLQTFGHVGRSSTKLLQDLIGVCPNLVKIEGLVPCNLMESLLLSKNNKMAAVSQLYFQPRTLKELDLTRSFLTVQRQIKKIVVATFCDRPWYTTNSTIFRQVIKLMYLSVQNCLQILQIPHINMLHFIGHSNMAVLPHLTHLHLVHDQSLDSRLGFSCLDRIDYSFSFPNLKFVEVETRCTCHQYQGVNFEAEDIHFWQQTTPQFVSMTVSTLKFSNMDLGPPETNLRHMELTNLTKLVHCFPQVRHLQVHNPWNLSKLLTHLWTFWPKLMSLTLTGVQHKYQWTNLDAGFTGMSQGDCQSLRKNKNFQDWQKLQVQKSMADLKELRLFRLHLNHWGGCGFDFDVDEDNGEISQVTTECVFNAMAQLTTVEVSARKCFGHESKHCYHNLDLLGSRVHFTVHTNYIPEGWNLV